MIDLGAFAQLKLARGFTLSRLKQSTEESWDVQPAGFSNTIRWNVGHVLVTSEYLIGRAIADYEKAYPEWNSFFAAGTRPETWDQEPPSIEALIKALKTQNERFESIVGDRVSETLVVPVTIAKVQQMNTLEEVLYFMSWHEATHSGLIQGLRQVIESE
ncbi:DinB family protein [Sporosarcina sp. CAU 1771]